VLTVFLKVCSFRKKEVNRCQGLRTADRIFNVENKFEGNGYCEKYTVSEEIDKQFI
jgi:hypothetical protein